MTDYLKYYSSFLKNKENETHLTSHSHHFWPDVTKEAALEAWDDSSKFVDHKWDNFFSSIAPKTRRLIAAIINLTDPNQIAFAPNTHELLFRLISCLIEKKSIRVLTTDSEFHSFDRQIDRLKEWDKFHITKINQEDPDFEKLLSAEASNQYDLIFVSHVFYNSGKMLSEETLRNLCENKAPETYLVIDGYHSYCALPVNWKLYEDHAFYISGSYKYAQAGEGLCFLTIPKNLNLRPVNTGWFAHFDSLANKPHRIKYSDGGDGFWGATQDMTPFYRFNAVWSLFRQDGITVNEIHQHVLALQEIFINDIDIPKTKLLNEKLPRAHFLAYQFENIEAAAKLEENLKKEKIFTDRRNAVLRFGFAPYHSKEQIKKVLIKIRECY